jgi:hypothetical protein
MSRRFPASLQHRPLRLLVGRCAASRRRVRLAPNPVISRISLVSAVTLAAAGLGPQAARADIVTFLPTGGEQTFTVPAGVTSLHMIAVGGKGGAGGTSGGAGGFGGLVSADVPVTAGQVLYVEVGGKGSS